MFVQIPEFPMYLIDENGTIVSMMRGRWTKLKLYYEPGRYAIATLRRDGKTVSKSVHRLVIETWRGKSNLQVNHKNGNKHDNRLENLEYCTSSENRKHAYATGLQDKTFEAVSKVGKAHRGEKHGGSKLTEENVRDILATKGVLSSRTAAQQFGISQSYVSQLWRGTSWKHLQKKDGSS